MKFIAFVLIFFTTFSLSAEPITAPAQKYESGFRAGAWEGSVGGVAYFSPYGPTRNRRTINYAVGTISAGYMLTDIEEWDSFRGNLEIVSEVFGGGVFAGKGHYLGGITFWPRFNFIQPGWRFVPYAQFGLGALGTDIDQDVVGQVFNFNLGIGLGGRYFLTPDMALDLQYRYQHISNAGMGEKNIGINAQGVWAGVSWLF